jgi:hypothetical protein
MSARASSPLVAFVIAVAACGHALPSPPLAAQPSSLFFEVPYPPPPPHAETVGARPSPRAVWIDGEWEWAGARWVWHAAGWTEPPPGAVKYALWSMRRTSEGRLLFAPGTWLSAYDTPIPPREPAAAQECTSPRAQARP